MGYEDAPATKMLASYCAACSKELVDAISVETGMGPHCRAKYGLPDAIDDDARAEANKLVHFIACEQVDGPEVRDALARLDALGCAVIVDRISKRLYGAPIKVTLDGSLLCVVSPYSGAFLGESKRIRSRRWDGANKRTTFNPADHKAVAAALVAGYRTGTRVFVGDSDTACALSDDMLDDLCDGYVAPPAPPTPVKVTRDENTQRVAIACPYDANVVAGMKAVDGRRWDAGNKVNTFPLTAEAEVLDLIRAAFARVHVVTEDGEVAAPKKSRSRGRRSYKRGYSWS